MAENSSNNHIRHAQFLERVYAKRSEVIVTRLCGCCVEAKQPYLGSCFSLARVGGLPHEDTKLDAPNANPVTKKNTPDPDIISSHAQGHHILIKVLWN